MQICHPHTPTDTPRIRRGKDILIRWTILTAGTDLPLEGRDLKLELITPGATHHPITDLTTQDNTLLARISGTLLTACGAHGLTLWENQGKEGQTATDKIPAFILVPTTHQETPAATTADLETETLDLATDNLSSTTIATTLTHTFQGDTLIIKDH